jgi:catechol 2,3-dioxygenase-like lactoylglutathione lyase family enzyme
MALSAAGRVFRRGELDFRPDESEGLASEATALGGRSCDARVGEKRAAALWRTQPDGDAMSSVDVSSESPTGTPPVNAGEFKLEVVVVPVSDVDRAKDFYSSLGWRLDADIARGDEFRLVQFTPPGSGCSIQLGTNIASAAPGSAQSLYLIVPDIAAAREELLARGVDVSEVFHEGAPGARFHDAGRVSGLAAERDTYGSFAVFSDPDGNGWLLQEITARLPGR